MTISTFTNVKKSSKIHAYRRIKNLSFLARKYLYVCIHSLDPRFTVETKSFFSKKENVPRLFWEQNRGEAENAREIIEKRSNFYDEKTQVSVVRGKTAKVSSSLDCSLDVSPQHWKVRPRSCKKTVRQIHDT